MQVQQPQTGQTRNIDPESNFVNFKLKNSNARILTNLSKLPNTSINLRTARHHLPIIREAIKRDQGWGSFGFWWHSNTISLEKVISSLESLSDDKKLEALAEIANNLPNFPNETKASLAQTVQHYIFENLLKFLSGDKEQIQNQLKRLTNIVKAMPYDEISQQKFTKASSIILYLAESREKLKSDEGSIKNKEEFLQDLKTTMENIENSPKEIKKYLLNTTLEYVIDNIIIDENYKFSEDVSIVDQLLNIICTPSSSSNIQAKFMAAYTYPGVFKELQQSNNIFVSTNSASEVSSKLGEGEQFVRRLSTISFNAEKMNTIKPAIFHPEKSEEFDTFYEAFQNTSFFKDIIERVGTEKISFGENNTWENPRPGNDLPQNALDEGENRKLNENRKLQTKNLLETMLKFTSGKESDFEEKDYDKACEFAKKFFSNYNCSENLSSIGYYMKTAIGANLLAPVNFYLNLDPKRVMHTQVTKDNKLISMECHSFDKTTLSEDKKGACDSLDEKCRDAGCTPNQFPLAPGSCLLYFRITTVDLNEDYPENINLDTDENTKLFGIMGVKNEPNQPI